MKTYEYTVFNPGGNVTALVTTKAPLSRQAEVGRAILNNPELKRYGIEQVGFVEPSDGTNPNTLRMAGGELCLNAARCASEYILQRSKTKKIKFNLISDEVMQVQAERRGNAPELQADREIVIKVDSVRAVTLNGTTLNTQIIALKGITQILTPFAQLPAKLQPLLSLSNQGLSSQELPALTKVMKELARLSPAAAVGLCAWEQLGPTNYRIRPLVWVEAINSTFYETACGSASVALAASLKQPGSYQIVQPSGSTLGVSVNNQYFRLSGQVKNLASGSITL